MSAPIVRQRSDATCCDMWNGRPHGADRETFFMIRATDHLSCSPARFACEVGLAWMRQHRPEGPVRYRRPRACQAPAAVLLSIGVLEVVVPVGAPGAFQSDVAVHTGPVAAVHQIGQELAHVGWCVMAQGVIAHQGPCRSLAVLVTRRCHHLVSLAHETVCLAQEPLP